MLATLKKAFSRKPAQGRRSYSSAQTSRLTSDWATEGWSVDQILKTALSTLRLRAQDLERNDDFTRRFLQVMENNVIGPQGIRYSAKTLTGNGTTNAKANNDAVEAAWADWRKPVNYSVSADLSGPAFDRLLLRRMLVDGEVFIVKRKGSPWPHGLALQMLESAVLDDQLNDASRNLVMGVEMDSWRRPLRYHFLADVNDYSRRHVVIPAGDVIHLFIKERPSQTRGVSWLAPSLLRQKMLQGFEEAALIAARIGAAKMGFLVGDEEYVGQGQDAQGFTRMSAEPGEIERINARLKFEPVDWKYPNTEYGQFDKAIKRGIASGLGVSYVTLANDLEGVNYSSIRQGTLEDREFFKAFTQHFIDHYLEPVADEWLAFAVASGRIDAPARRIEQLRPRTWRPRGWQWVDPQKMILAYENAVKLGVMSRTQIASELGRDLEEVYEELAAEKALAEAYDLDIGKPPVQLVAPQEPPADDEPEGEEDGTQEPDQDD